jgi:hypothetical protein
MNAPRTLAASSLALSLALLLLPGGSASAAAPTPPPAAPAGDAAGAKASGLAGVWMGFKFLPGTGSYEPQARWVTLFDDGTSFGDLPSSGLAAFDRRASQANPSQSGSWGTWTVKGASGAIQKPGVRFPTVISVVGPDRIKLDSDVFHRSVSVNGLRLQGSWTSYANPADPALARLPAGQRPVISFTRDGQFKDDGVFATFLRSSYGQPDPRDQAGSGTYRVADFTLILTYADGRTRHEAFTGLLGGNPAESNAILFIRRSRFNRMP